MKVSGVLFISILLHPLAHGFPVKFRQPRDASLHTEESRSLKFVKRPIIQNGNPTTKKPGDFSLRSVLEFSKPSLDKKSAISNGQNTVEVRGVDVGGSTPYFVDDDEDSPRGGWKRVTANNAASTPYSADGEDGPKGSWKRATTNSAVSTPYFVDDEDLPKGGWKRVTANSPVTALKHRRSVSPGGETGGHGFPNSPVPGLKQKRSINPGPDSGGDGITDSPVPGLKQKRSIGTGGDGGGGDYTNGPAMASKRKGRRSMSLRGDTPPSSMYDPSTGGS